jgi:hypothetical protein
MMLTSPLSLTRAALGRGHWEVPTDARGLRL